MEFREVEGFQHVGLSAQADGTNREVLRLRRRDHDDGSLLVPPSHLTEDLESIQLWKTDIQQDSGKPAFLHGLESLHPVDRRFRFITLGG